MKLPTVFWRWPPCGLCQSARQSQPRVLRHYAPACRHHCSGPAPTWRPITDQPPLRATTLPRITGWQREYKLAEDELDDPRALALPNWTTLTTLADALVARSTDRYRGWGDAVIFEACTAARIGEVAGCLVRDIDTDAWIWTVRRQTTPSPGGLVDKNTKGKRAREVPLITPVRDLVQRRIELTEHNPDARLFTGPRGGRITTATLRDATSWDAVVTQLGYEKLTRHGLRHTGLTWMADAGVPVHTLRKIAGHGAPTTTQRYLHPDRSPSSTQVTCLSGTCGPQVVPSSASSHLDPIASPQVRSHFSWSG